MMELTQRPSRSFVILVVFLAMAVAGSSRFSAGADKPRRSDQQSYRSAHFIVHTDLAPDATRALLERLESTLADTIKYWKRPVRGLIECYVVDNLDNWLDSELPHPLARVLIGRVGGGAIADRVGAGVHSRIKVRVFASSQHGVAEHEIVHAYCGQTFGGTGPIWYREGMAQLVAFGVDKDQGMNCPPTTLEQLTSGRRRTLRQVVRGGESSRQLTNMFKRKTNRRAELVGLVPLGDWTQNDIRSLEQVKQSYAWNWLVCHLLHHNANYSSRFATLGQAYLGKRQDKFAMLFDPMLDQLVFEYNFTLDRLGPGYRIDLCSWDWSKRCRCLEHGHSSVVNVASARGYQPTGLLVTAGRRYRYSAQGTWRVGAEDPPTDADGDKRGNGRLEAVVMKGFQLSEPFDLACSGRFRSPSDGHLYLRCRDDWTRIGDNQGSIAVTFSR